MAKKYDLGEKYGSDSVSEFFRPSSPLPDRTVINKRIFPELTKSPSRIARIQESVLLFSPPIHKNVARVLEFVRDGSDVFYSVELCDCRDISEWCEVSRPIDEILPVLRQLVEALAAVHRRGIIHRNIKPETVFRSADGFVKLGESVIAVDISSKNEVADQSVVAEVDLVPPEYLEYGELSISGDIYSIGLLAYEMITGRPPFQGKSVIETMTKRLKEEVPSPRAFRPDCPQSLANVIIRATRRDTSERYQHADDMLAELTNVKAP